MSTLASIVGLFSDATPADDPDGEGENPAATPYEYVSRTGEKYVSTYYYEGNQHTTNHDTAESTEHGVDSLSE